jgi:hypothetical protein
VRLWCGTGVLIACGLAVAGCGDQASPPAKRAAVIDVDIDRVFSIEADGSGGDVLDPTTADSPGATGCSSRNLDLVMGKWESRSDGNQGVAYAKVPNRGLVFD